MNSLAATAIPPRVLDEALAWAVKLRSGTADGATRAACESWRNADPVHENAWQALEAIEQVFETVPALPPRIALTTLESAHRKRAAGTSRRRALKLLGLGATGGAALWIAAGHAPWRELVAGFSADYTTATGERRAIMLADGSRLDLNTSTAVDVRFATDGRLILLRQGEIRVSTGKDETFPAGSRPLRVETAQGRFEPIGTRFHLRTGELGTRLHVEDGAVRIASRYGTERMVAQTGETFDVTSSGATPASHSAFDVAAWTDGALVAKQMRLADFLAELSRYRPGWLRCDPAVADLRISGVFQLDDTDSVLDALARSLPVRAEYRTRYWVTVVSR